MSRPINDSISLLTETLGNCKTALTDKKVENVETIKISDVDEKIAEIQVGSGEGNNKYTITVTYYVGTVYDSYEDPNCKLRSQDKSLNYEPIKVKQSLVHIGDGDEHDGYSYYTFEIPCEDITEYTVLELCDLDKSEEVVEYCEILSNGFRITYEPKFKLIKSDTNEHIGYLSDDVFTYGNKYKKFPKYQLKAIYEINIPSKSVTEVSQTDGFQLSLHNLNLITTTDPYLIYDRTAGLIKSINQVEEGA